MYLWFLPQINLNSFFLKKQYGFKSKISTKKIKGKNEVEKEKKKKKIVVVPTPGIEPGPRRWERRILTTRPYGINDWSVGIFRILTTLPRD